MELLNLTIYLLNQTENFDVYNFLQAYMILVKKKKNSLDQVHMKNKRWQFLVATMFVKYCFPKGVLIDITILNDVWLEAGCELLCIWKYRPI